MDQLTTLEEDLKAIGLTSRTVEDLVHFGSTERELAESTQLEESLMADMGLLGISEALRTKKLKRMSPSDRAKARASYRTQRAKIKVKRKKLRKKPSFKRKQAKLKKLKHGRKAGAHKRFVVTGMEQVGGLVEEIRKFDIALGGQDAKKEMCEAFESLKAVAGALAQKMVEAEEYVDDMEGTKPYRDEDDFIDSMGEPESGDLIRLAKSAKDYDEFINDLPYEVDPDDPVVRRFYDKAHSGEVEEAKHTKEYVVKVGDKFVGHGKLVSEYPDAVIFKSIADANKVADKFSGEKQVGVYTGYGMDSELLVYNPSEDLEESLTEEEEIDLEDLAELVLASAVADAMDEKKPGHGKFQGQDVIDVCRDGIANWEDRVADFTQEKEKELEALASEVAQSDDWVQSAVERSSERGLATDFAAQIADEFLGEGSEEDDNSEEDSEDEIEDEDDEEDEIEEDELSFLDEPEQANEETGKSLIDRAIEYIRTKAQEVSVRDVRAFLQANPDATWKELKDMIDETQKDAFSDADHMVDRLPGEPYDESQEGTYKDQTHGKLHKTKVFKTDKEANEFMGKNPGYGVIGVKPKQFSKEGDPGYEVHVAKIEK